MTSKGVQDLVGVFSALIVASLTTFLVPSTQSILDPVFAVIALIAGWFLARFVFRQMENASHRQALRSSKASQKANDADFARALFGKDEPDLK